MRKDIFNEVRRQMSNDIKINCAEMARRFSCDPRTVKSYMEGKNPERKLCQKKSILDKYKDIIIDKVDKYGATGMAVYYLITKRGYTGSYSTVKKFVRKHKKEQRKKATIRFETVPGLQGQVDWKEEMKLVNRNGEVFKINIFLYIAGYSRHKYFELTMDRKQDTLFRCMTNAFRYNSGTLHEIWFDNMTTVVDRPNTAAQTFELNPKMHQYAKDFGFSVFACRAYRPQTKGKAEVLAKLMNRLKAFNEEFETIEELDAIVREFNTDINSEICQATNERPIDRHSIEKPFLLPLPNEHIIESYTKKVIERKVSKESMITFNEKKYSVPTRYIDEKVEVKCQNETLMIYHLGSFIKSHPISNKIFNYKEEDIKEILRSEAFKYKTDEEIEAYAKQHLESLDQLLGGVYEPI